jgi:hypothetical protein
MDFGLYSVIQYLEGLKRGKGTMVKAPLLSLKCFFNGSSPIMAITMADAIPKIG